MNKKIFFSFLYIAGEMNKNYCIINIGVETKKDANREILRLEIKTSGKAVNIILCLERVLLSTEKSGLVKIFPRYVTL